MNRDIQNVVQFFSSSSGTLSVLSFSSIPFEVKRIYWINSVPPGHVRGKHAHKTLSQFFVVLKGTVEIELRNCNSKEILNLGNNGKILVIGPGIWRELRRFSPDAILLVGASEDYDSEDYISSWDEYEVWSKESQE